MNNMSIQDNINYGIVFYDGLCVVCSKEIEHYKKLKGAEKFKFLDITEKNFNAMSYGVDPYKVHKVMHVRGLDGNLYTGPNAFRAIWKELPRYKFLFSLTNNVFALFFMNIGYSCFVRIRPYLPRKKANCEISPYCELSNKK